MAESLKQRIQGDMKQAMRDKDSVRLGVIRLMLSAIKQREVDERIELNDEQVVEILTKMLKQRRDSVTQYEQAGRNDLSEIEKFEITVVSEYMPPALDDAEVDAMIAEVIAETGATSAKEMGKVIGRLKGLTKGRVDMGVVSAKVKAALN